MKGTTSTLAAANATDTWNVRVNLSIGCSIPCGDDCMEEKTAVAIPIATVDDNRTRVFITPLAKPC